MIYTRRELMKIMVMIRDEKKCSNKYVHMSMRRKLKEICSMKFTHVDVKVTLELKGVKARNDHKQKLSESHKSWTVSKLYKSEKS